MQSDNQPDFTGYPYVVDLSTPALRLAHLARRRADRDAGVTHPIKPVPGLYEWLARQVRREMERGE